MTTPRKLFGVTVIVLVATILSGVATDRLILKLAEEHQSSSPQLSLAAAMGGLFAAGLVGLLALLIVFRQRASKP